MKINLKYTIIASALFTLGVQGQEKQVEKAQTKFNSFDFTEAIASYEELVAKGNTSEEVYKNLGDANYMNANYDEASNWYAKLFELNSPNLDSEYIYKYAQTLKSLKKYEESDLWMAKFESVKSSDNRAKKFSNEKDYLEEIKNNSGRYSIKNSSINSKESDFSPAFYKNELIFSSARDSGITSKNVHLWNKKPFLNLYKSTVSEDESLSDPVKLSKVLNKKTHESSPVFTKDGNTMYFVRNNSQNGKFSRDEQGVSRLKVFKASLENNEWNNVVELPFNSDEYSAAHPALNADESKLYFSSDMPGTIGQSDIFYVDIKADGSYGAPVNLGKSVNTEGRETFPFISENNVLFFASDGYPGLGGLDVFGVDLEHLSKAKAINLGAPVNSEADDFSYIINDVTKKGYFASNRKEGVGSDDIYSFLETTPLDFSCNTIINGIVKDKKTMEIIPNAIITITDTQGNIVTKGLSNSKGEYNLNADCENAEYTISATHKDFIEGTLSYRVTDNLDASVQELFLASNMNESGLGNDLTKDLRLDPIYFDLDKSFIRRDAQEVLERVLAYMKQYPDAKIEVRSHTDSRANDNYNLRLSERRAKSTVAYLIKKGVDSARLTSKGYGETQLTNGCNNDTKCSSEEHQMNRRSEFIVVQ